MNAKLIVALVVLACVAMSAAKPITIKVFIDKEHETFLTVDDELDTVRDLAKKASVALGIEYIEGKTRIINHFNGKSYLFRTLADAGIRDGSDARLVPYDEHDFNELVRNSPDRW